MAIQVNIQRTINRRVEQFALFIRELKIIAGQIVTAIDAGPVQAIWFVNKQNSLAQVKANFTNWPYGSLTNATMRAAIAAQWPDDYTGGASQVQTEIAAINTLFTQMTAELETAIDIARERGQLVDSSPTTNLVVYQTLSSPDTDALRAKAVEVRDAIAGETT